MKLSNLVIIFVTGFLVFFMWHSYVAQKTISYNTTNKEYSIALATACHDAVKGLKTEYCDNDGIFTSKMREESLKRFYDSLARSMGVDDTYLEESLVDKTPFVIFIDNTGFYISYNANYDEEGLDDASAYEKPNVMTNLNTWSENRSGIKVRYYLSDWVDVIFPNGTMYSGTRQDVYAKSGNHYLLAYLNDDADFDKNKRDVIIKRIENVINHILNTQVVNVDRYATGYQVSLPQITGEEWSRMLKNPTVISFLQGKQVNMENQLLNIYGYAAGEITEENMYQIKGNYYYPVDTNGIEKTVETVIENGQTITVIKYKESGSNINNFGNMLECAEQGKNPDITAYSRNE